MVTGQEIRGKKVFEAINDCARSIILGSCFSKVLCENHRTPEMEKPHEASPRGE